MKVAFWHPDLKGEVLVFIHSDMPHLVKKIVNALERSSLEKHKTDLQFRKMPLNLRMLEKIWEEGDGGCTGPHSNSGLEVDSESLRQGPVLSDAFFFLAAQVTSQSMCLLIDSHADVFQDGKSFYGPVREILSDIDKLIDIMNARTDRECGPISSPESELLTDLEGTVKLFTEWKQEAGTNKEHFIPESSYEDLCWVCLGTIGIARQHLKADKSRTLSQDRSGSDVCEHHFANAKNLNPNGTKADHDNAVAKSTTVRSNTFNTSSKTNTARSVLRVDELTQPLFKPSSKK